VCDWLAAIPQRSGRIVAMLGTYPRVTVWNDFCCKQDLTKSADLLMRRAIERLRAEFMEMPGLRLTIVQIQRLCGMDQTLCQNVLDALVNMKFLRVNPDGTYARLSDVAVARIRPARANVNSPDTVTDVNDDTGGTRGLG
jgi:hypothetical protein